MVDIRDNNADAEEGILENNPVMENEVEFSESDTDWVRNEKNESEYETEDESVEDSEPEHGVVSDNDTSDFEEKQDKPGDKHSDEDKEPEVYTDRAFIGGTEYALDVNGRVFLKRGLLFDDVYHFREVLKDFLIQEGFEIVRLKNERSRVTAKCAAEGCKWRIHASHLPDGVTFQIRTYNGVHDCIRTLKNKDANSVWIAAKLEKKLKEDSTMSYVGMKVELMEKYGIEPSNNMVLYRAKKRVNEESKTAHGKSYDIIPAWAELCRETNPGSVVKMELEPRLNKNP